MHFTIKKRKQKEKQEESQFIKFSNNTIARQESKKESSKEKEKKQEIEKRNVECNIKTYLLSNCVL